MKTFNRKTLPSFTFSLLVTAVQIELFARMILMGRRKRARYLNQTLIQQVRSRQR